MDFSLTEDQQALALSVRQLANDKFAAAAFTHDGFAWDSLRTLARAGLTGLLIPPADGGQGASLMDAVVALEEVSKVCPHSGDAMQAANFGAILQVARLGSPELKAAVLPALLAGDALVTVGMSEPEAGSALTRLRTSALLDGDEVVLNGEKCWNSNGPEATYVVIWARFGPTTDDIGAVLVPTDSPGFTRGRPERYMSGERHCSLYLNDCRVPESHVLATGGILSRLLANFGIERIGNATRSLALAQTAFDRAVVHAASREQSGKKLREFQGLQWKFAEMRIQLDAARLLLYRAACSGANDAPSSSDAAIAKAYINQMAVGVANDSLQVFGAAGYTQGHPLEYIARRVRGWMIAGGTREVLYNSIARDVFSAAVRADAADRPTPDRDRVGAR